MRGYAHEPSAPNVKQSPKYFSRRGKEATQQHVRPAIVRKHPARLKRRLYMAAGVCNGENNGAMHHSVHFITHQSFAFY